MNRTKIQDLITRASENSYSYSVHSALSDGMRKALINILENGIQIISEEAPCTENKQSDLFDFFEEEVPTA